MNENSESSPSQLLTVMEVAAKLRLSRSHTYQLVMSEAISSVKIGRCRRVSAESVAAFIRQLEVVA